jgi:hypothetical protein
LHRPQCAFGVFSSLPREITQSEKFPGTTIQSEHVESQTLDKGGATEIADTWLGWRVCG